MGFLPGTATSEIYVPISDNLLNLSNFPMFPFLLPKYTEGIEAQMYGYYGNTYVVTMVTLCCYYAPTCCVRRQCSSERGVGSCPGRRSRVIG